MHVSLRVLMLLVLSCLPLSAQEQSTDVGRGVLCDTVQQVERFIALRDNGRDTLIALETVNDEAHYAAACSLVLVMFTDGKPIAELTVKGKLVFILLITVHAFGNGSAWRHVPTIDQYTVVVEKGQVI